MLEVELIREVTSVIMDMELQHAAVGKNFTEERSSTHSHKFCPEDFVASSIPSTCTHTHILKAHTADNRQTLGSKLIITPWHPQQGSSTRREGTSLSEREITLSLCITKHHTAHTVIKQVSKAMRAHK